MSGPGSGITVFNDDGTTFVEDSYTVTAGAPAVTGKKLFGLDLSQAQFVLVNADRTMFSDTSLPSSPSVFRAAEQAQTSILLFNPSTHRDVSLYSDFPYFQLSPYHPLSYIAAINDDMAALQLDKGVVTSLQKTLEKAAEYISGTSSNHNAKAELELRRFVNQVSALSGKSIPVDAANGFIGTALGLIDLLPACS